MSHPVSHAWGRGSQPLLPNTCNLSYSLNVSRFVTFSHYFILHFLFALSKYSIACYLQCTEHKWRARNQFN